ncbi:MAG: hypothetical protein KME11_12020 [Timaviella obliquedivisa GSE-PSE-MK23-08B]|jgi:hypothetical protein|nr:hypothetical protein [Timaviella obliquedivisa GSE-PSE-MK23-08B]
MKPLTDNPEENTQSYDLTGLRMPRKRRAESPGFWVPLVGGSLLLHGALLAIALPLAARLSAASQSGSPTPVEFVELSEPFPEVALSQPSTEFAAPPSQEPISQEPASQEPVPADLVPTQPAFSESIPPSDISFAPEPSPTILPSPTPSPEVLPSPESSSEPVPEISPSPVFAETPFETAAIPPQPDSLPLPVLPSVTPVQPSSEPPQPLGALEATPEAPIPETPDSEAIAPESSLPEAPLDTSGDRPQPESFPADLPATTLPPPDLPDPPPQNLPSEPDLQTTAIDTPVPDVSESIAVAPSTVDSDNLNSANSEAAPLGVTLTLFSSSRGAPGAGTADETLELARPVNNSSTFLPDPSASACQVTPEVLNRVGTPIALTITTENQPDKPIDVKVYQSSGSFDYDELAACLVREQWVFEPATILNAEGTQRQTIRSDELLMTITINRS